MWVDCECGDGLGFIPTDFAGGDIPPDPRVISYSTDSYTFHYDGIPCSSGMHPLRSDLSLPKILQEYDEGEYPSFDQVTGMYGGIQNVPSAVLPFYLMPAGPIRFDGAFTRRDTLASRTYSAVMAALTVVTLSTGIPARPSRKVQSPSLAERVETTK